MSPKIPLHWLCLALLLPGLVLANIEAPAVVSASDPAATPLAEVSEAAVTDPKPVPARAEIDSMVEAAAKRHGVELALVKAVAPAESAE